MKIGETTTMWVCVDEDMDADYTSVAPSEIESIFQFDNLGAETLSEFENFWKKYGWQCIQVDITITPTKTSTP